LLFSFRIIFLKKCNSELIQNADDAGASVVRIMIDENNYGTESLLGPSMAELQGPSVIVFNDAKFTEADFKSLASIGQGSKLDRLAATGRFGLGFNSVYHITDTPTFVSGDFLVLFDPHTTNIPGASLTQPGLRIRFKSSNLHKSFPDQFSPYHFFGCNFEDAFEGTLFRLPLRSGKLAKISEISKRAYSIGDVNTIVGHLQSNLAQHLLFLRSVKAIEIFRCPIGSSEPILLHRATSAKSDYRTINDQSLLQFLEKKSSSGSTSLTSRDSFYAMLSKMPESQLPTISYRIVINTSSTTLDDAVDEEVKSYYVVTGLRGGEARQLACDSSTRNLKLIPMGSVACCISPEVKFIPLTGQAFCFLPLPVKSKLETLKIN
jgi:sacsin